jgi:Ca2+-binding RTX toxin-like protein
LAKHESINCDKSVFVRAFVVVAAVCSLAFLSGAGDAAAAICDGFHATIVGTPGNDRIVGTAGSDRIQALAGNDIIWGLKGDDSICGGDGADIIYAGPARDAFIGGGDGPDVIYARLRV